MKTQPSNRSAFTLVEIMIVVAIIGLLASIAIPSLVNAQRKAKRQACICTLNAIRGAKTHWALENKKADTDVPNDAELWPDKYIEKAPQCPGGGSYNLNAVKDNPTCSVQDHVL